MEIDLSQLKLKYSVREVILVITFISGLTAHVIRTELQNEQLSSRVDEIKIELRQCQDRLASSPQVEHKFKFVN